MSKFRTFLEAIPNPNMVGTDPFGMYGNQTKMTQGEVHLAALQKLNNVAQNIHAAIQSGHTIGRINGTTITDIPENEIAKGNTRGGLSHQELLNLLNLTRIRIVTKDKSTGLFSIHTGNLRKAYVNAERQASQEKTLQSLAPAALAAGGVGFLAKKTKGVLNKPGSIQPWWKTAGFR